MFVSVIMQKEVAFNGENKSKKRADIYFILSGAAFALFLLLIILLKTVDIKTITLIGSGGTFDIKIGLSTLNIAVSDAIAYNSLWYKITGVSGILPLAVAGAFVVLGLVQLISRKSLKKVDGEIYLLGSFYVLTLAVYVFFEKVIINYRPIILNKTPEASFPSSHTMLAVFICLSASFTLEKYVKSHAILNITQIALGALTGIIVLGRILSGVHWATDIIGGLLISLALYFCYKALYIKLFNE